MMRRTLGSMGILVVAVGCSGTSGSDLGVSDWSEAGSNAADGGGSGDGSRGGDAGGGSGSSGGGASSGSSGGSGGGGGSGSGGSGSGGSGSGAGSGGPVNLDDARDECVKSLNRYRAMQSLPPLVRWTSAEACADNQSMIDANEYKQNPSSWHHNNYGMCGEGGQCACWAGGDPSQMVVQCAEWYWNEGPGGIHHDIMMSPNFTKVACGFSNNGPGGWWSDQDFR